MPSRWRSASAWTALVNSAICRGETATPRNAAGAAASQTSPSAFTTLRSTKRLIFCVSTNAVAAGVSAPPQPAFSVSISMSPAFSSSVMRPTRSRTRASTGRRQSSYGSSWPLPLASLKRRPSTERTARLRTPMPGCGWRAGAGRRGATRPAAPAPSRARAQPTRRSPGVGKASAIMVRMAAPACRRRGPASSPRPRRRARGCRVRPRGARAR